MSPPVRRRARGVRARGVGLTVLMAVAWAAAAGAVVATSPPAAAATLDSISDRTHKANMRAALSYKPRIVFFGGSRSLRFEPSYTQQLTGLKGFNAAFVNCKPEDVWAFSHYINRRAPTVHLHAVWGIQPGGLFTNAQFDPGLIRDIRLSRWFPLSLRQSMGSGLPHPWANRTYLRDGALVYDNYDRKEEAGRTLDESLDAYIARALRQKSDQDAISSKMTRARQYFQKELVWLDDHGCQPLLIIMPIHPRVIAAIRDEHWDNWRQSFIDYLASLQAVSHFTVLDFTFISSFNGDPDAFYDGVHMKRSNMRRLLKAAVEKAPWAFGLAPAPWDPPPYGTGLAYERRQGDQGDGPVLLLPAP